MLVNGAADGRKVFANVLKYVRMGAGSNFGDMFSVVGGSVFLRFVPMAPLQFHTNNLFYDLPQVANPTEDADAEYVTMLRLCQ